MGRKKKDERRANGDGTFDVLPSGKIRYRVAIGEDVFGKPIRKSFVDTTETKCKGQYKEWLKNYDPIAPIEKSETVGDWATHWVEVYKKEKASWQVYQDYKSIIKNHIKPALGHIKMKEVKPANMNRKLSEHGRTKVGGIAEATPPMVG